LSEIAIGHQLLHLGIWEMRKQRFADTGGVDVYAPPQPSIHLHKAGRLYFLNVHRAPVIQDSQVRGQTGGVHQLAQYRQRHLANVQPRERAVAQADHRQADMVAAVFASSAQVASVLQRPEDVAG
jgi:hypothetical protein